VLHHRATLARIARMHGHYLARPWRSGRALRQASNAARARS
jgi:hypothetical protein